MKSTVKIVSFDVTVKKLFNMVLRNLISAGLAVVMAFLINPGHAQVTSDAGSDEGSPQIKFQTKTHDFGEIPQGKPASYSFEFTNTGEAPLTLEDVKPSCGCTTPEWPRKPIRPGQSSTVRAVYDAGSPGRFQKSITVKTNIEDNSRIVLSIKGRVQQSN